MSPGQASRRQPGAAGSPEGRPPPEPVIATTLRALVHAVTAAVFALPISVGEGVVAAGAGAALGSVLGRFLGRGSVRTPVLLSGAVVALLVVVWLADLAVSAAWLPARLGPAGALRFSDALELGLGALVVSAALRLSSVRRPPVAVVEVALVALSFAQLVVAHRNGAINRPFEIADPLIAQGLDPSMALLLIGGAASVVVVLLLLVERSLLRSALHLAVVVLVLFLVVAGTAMVGLPGPPQTGAGLGLRADREDEERERRDGRSSGRRSNEELEFRDNYNSEANRVPVGVVLLHDDYSPPSGLYYFRQGAFSQYNGRRLVSATRSDVDLDIAPRFPTSPMQIAGAPDAGWNRATLETTVALLADHNRPFALESPTELRPEPNPDPRRFRRIYRATSAVLTADFASMLGTRAGDPAWTPAQWAHYTETSPDPRYAELAGTIVGALPPEVRDEPIAEALAITGWLGEQGVYSLRSAHADAADPTASFLFGDRTGYCVHFAHAAAYLMRSAGLPSRVATGYAVEESARAGGSALLITGNASHAWPEIYMDGVGWVVVDVSPQTVLSPPPPPPDPDLQRLLAELVRGQRPLPVDGRPPPPVAEMAGAAVVTVGRLVGGLAVSVLLLLFASKLWRWLAPKLTRGRALPRVLYRAELDRLSELNHRRRWGESREAFAARVADVSPTFATLTRHHVAAAFGSRRFTRDLPALARAVRAERRAAFPWWRRLLGALTPWSWLLSR